MRLFVLAIGLSFACLAKAKIILNPSPPNLTSGIIRTEGKPVGISLYDTDPKLHYGVFIYENGDCKNPLDLIDASKIPIESKWGYRSDIKEYANGPYAFGYYDPNNNITFSGHDAGLDNFIHALTLKNKVFVLQVIDKDGKSLGKVACGIHP